MSLPADLLLGAISSLLRNPPTSDAASPSADQPAVSSSRSDSRLVSAPLPAAPPAPTAIARNPRVSIHLPFQFLWYDITGTESSYTSLSIASRPEVVTVARPYRHARLTSLEAFVQPTASSATYPQTVDLCWTIDSVTPARSEILSVFGAQRIAWGSVHFSAPILLPAELSSLNPTIKDSLTYTDCPRLTCGFYRNDACVALGSSAPICGSILIRGVTECSAPTNRPTPSS
uniref:Coat protein n=1 Tax=Grapevine fleck virus TaxID=103722 RepID=A0A7S6NG16_9VIRU|nr:coat protein [Grapevine fleck virus]